METNKKTANKIGYWASQEQYSMQDLLKFAIESERNGFSECMTSDHFHPWWHDGGFGNFTWIWMSAAAERTKKMKFITGVTAAVYRYNPAIIAQAFSSLDVLYPGRIGLGIGSGEAMNEVPLGFDWCPADIRLEITKEAIQIIRFLWRRPVKTQNETVSIDKEGFVTFEGKHFKIRNARLYTPPKTKIPLYMAAVGEEATKAAAKLTDGLITVSKPDKSKEIFDIFEKQARMSEKDPGTMEKIGKPKISYNLDYEQAFRSSEFWRASSLKNAFDLNISDPRDLEEKAKREVSDKKLKESTLIVTSIEDCIKPIEEYFRAGFTKIYVQSTSPDELEFIKEFSKRVIPYFEAQA
jgi:coenzyme F420-dependent glucose-6-phosphate dehydrogenase